VRSGRGGGGGLASTFVQERVSPLPSFLYQITGDLLMKKPEPAPFGLNHAPYLTQKHHETRKCDGDRATGKRQRNERIMRSSTVK
jgi:hypothetical protein